MWIASFYTVHVIMFLRGSASVYIVHVVNISIVTILLNLDVDVVVSNSVLSVCNVSSHSAHFISTN